MSTDKSQKQMEVKAVKKEVDPSKIKTRFCKYGEKCNKKATCTYAHTKEEKVVGMCKYDDKCRRLNCDFKHTEYSFSEWVQYCIDNNLPEYRTFACKRANECTLRGCIYAHSASQLRGWCVECKCHNDECGCVLVCKTCGDEHLTQFCDNQYIVRRK